MSDDVKYVDVYASTATVAPLSTAPLATVRRFESVTTSDHTTTRVTRVHNFTVPSIARDGITAHGWTFTSVKGSISPAADIDAFEKHTGVKVPEMVYLANALVLSHEATGSVFSFNAKDALAACALPVSAEKSKGESYQGTTNAVAATSATTITTPLLPHSLSQPCSSSSSPRPSLASLSSSPVPATSTSRPVQVKMASAWKNRDLPSDLEQIEMTYDWTYTPAYKGTLFFNRSPSPTSCSTPSASSPSSFCLPPSSSPSSFTAIPLPLVPTDAALDMDLMRRKDQIVWFDDVLLYEDELHDNGVSKLSVKIRVMPAYFLVLMRFWLRVDDVVMRVHDSRFFHLFGCDHVLLDVQQHEETFASLQARGLNCEARFYDSPDVAVARLPVTVASKHLVLLTGSAGAPASPAVAGSSAPATVSAAAAAPASSSSSSCSSSSISSSSPVAVVSVQQ